MSTILSSTAPHIYQLPDEILSYICLLAAEPSLLYKSLQVGIKRADISFHTQKYRSKLGEELKVARALRLVSRRFSYLATPLVFERIVLIQYRTDAFRAPWVPRNHPISQAKASRFTGMGVIMKKLHDLFWLKPELRRHCKSLCVVYGELPWDVLYASDDGGEENSFSGIDNEHEDELGSGNDEDRQSSGLVHCSGLLEDFICWLTNVNDLHVHVGRYTTEMPDFSLALRSMLNLTTLRITGQIDYLPVFEQIMTLEPDATIQTLDISDVSPGGWDYHEISEQKVIRKLQVS
ncbi:hypothetical protein ACHAPJ_010331 [Fusarium lateritium]